jgi:hypothetical protein
MASYLAEGNPGVGVIFLFSGIFFFVCREKNRRHRPQTSLLDTEVNLGRNLTQYHTGES